MANQEMHNKHMTMDDLRRRKSETDEYTARVVPLFKESLDFIKESDAWIRVPIQGMSVLSVGAFIWLSTKGNHAPWLFLVSILFGIIGSMLMSRFHFQHAEHRFLSARSALEDGKWFHFPESGVPDNEVKYAQQGNEFFSQARIAREWGIGLVWASTAAFVGGMFQIILMK